MEMVIVAALVLFLFEYNNIISSDKLVADNKALFNKMKEKDYEFLVRLKYGDTVEPEVLYMKRVKNGLLVTIVILLAFITNFSVITVLISIGIGAFVYKSSYMNLKKFYKVHLSQINSLLPYYLKTLEILAQHYTVPVALAKSVKDAPDVFRPGLKTLIDKINAGDSSINPYMDFAKEYPVRDSMRMMRLLYRLGIGSQDKKQSQLIAFSRSVSNLQQKAREQKYKSRLEKMESKTMTMLLCTGAASMLFMIIAIAMTMM
ncbi:MAG: hypothetical protein Q4G04_00330 [bacterium]|nr:hypothetical protein [bacterium]